MGEIGADAAAQPAILAGLDEWRTREARHQPIWPDTAALNGALDELKGEPPLVFAGEVDQLRARLADVAHGQAFLLQGGDCAEVFSEAKADTIRGKIRTILQMAVVLTYGGSMPVVKMGRMAGQYAKPRSNDTEVVDGVNLPTYKGDAVNSYEPTIQARTPNPERMVEAYHRSSATLNLIRAFTMGGFADLRLVHEWNRGFMAGNPSYSQYEDMAAEIDRAMKFMESCGVDFERLQTVEFWASHEALLLEYERALTRIDSRTGLPYDCSAHFVWIGERTRQADGAHVSLLSKIRNPVGVKLGPTTSEDDALRLLDILDPEREPGRLTLIARMGASQVRTLLPPLVAAVAREGHDVVWSCDPMHGNTFTSSTGYKTRRFSTVVDEVQGFFEVHRAAGTIPGGLCIELTGNDVTEIIGGSDEIEESTLPSHYETVVDPRLNHQQSLELAFKVAEMIREGR